MIEGRVVGAVDVGGDDVAELDGYWKGRGGVLARHDWTAFFL